MDNELETSHSPEQQEEFLIVGVGASAGGVEALKAFFSKVQKDSGAAYVVILHLSPDHESRLAELLQAVSAAAVIQVQRRVQVRPDCVYVVPPNQSLSMDDGYLALSPVVTQEQRRAPIDIFFRTLGDSQRSRSVCVVLSGTGTDGAAGLKRVKECGGLCIVQEPTEAQHDGMPRHAIATQLVDDVLLVGDMPARINAYRRHREQVQAQAEGRSDGDEQALREILSQLRVNTGHDFASYKRPTLLRRIERRLALHELPDLIAYASWLKKHPDEARALLKDLLISVTEFFRDPEAFEALNQHVIPRLFRNKGASEYVRVWIAGCATGEEVYSVAMLLCEHAVDPSNTPAIQIFATDIDEWALAKARAGLYTATDVAKITPERLRRFFVHERDGFRVRPELRELVLFAPHNLLRHPPYSHLDLITCRNLLIYINKPAQQRVLEVFHFGLKPEAFLFLGSSESLDGAAELFMPMIKEARIFQSRIVERRILPAFTNLNATPPSLPVGADEPAPQVTQARLSRQALHQQVLEAFAPPSVLVTSDHELVHLSNTAARYLTFSGGEPSRDLLAVVRPELRIDLRGALYEAAQQRTPVTTRPLEVLVEGTREQVRLVVRPVLGEHEGLLAVFFERGDHPGDKAEHVEAGPAVAEGPAVKRLEEEVVQLRAQLAATIAQHGHQQETVRAANEELQSLNEELRSTSEELETGKEELQSYNEELSTVNQELKVKIDELTQANNDTRNWMNSADTAMLFLDRDMCVRRFTAPAAALFNLLPADVGRPLLHFAQKVQYDELEGDAARVRQTLQTVERELKSNSGRWYLVRMLPYRTEDDRIDGTVLTFTDVTARKVADDALRTSEEQFRRAIEEAPIPVVMQAEDGEILQVSRSWTELTGYTLQEMPTADAWLTRAYGHGAEAVRDYMHELFAGARRVLSVEFTIKTRANTERQWSFSASSPGTLGDGRRFIVGMALDVTERKAAQDALGISEERLRLTVESVADYAIFTMNSDGVIETWNVGAENIFGYTAAEAIGQPLAMTFTPEDRHARAPEEEMRTAGERGSAADERWHIRKNGDRFFASGVLSRLKNDGVLLGYTKVAQDLTAKQKAAEDLRVAHDELETRVAARTRELAEANAALRAEVAERKESEELRVRLLSQLVDSQENERRRISRELHDQLGQQLTTLGVQLRALKTRTAHDAATQADIANLEAIAKQIDADLDFLVWELRPTTLDDLGLVEALSDYVVSWSKHIGVKAHIDTSRMQGPRLPTDTETVLYRIAQEALNNVAKHAAARNVDLLLEQRSEQVCLIIEDDGMGFDVEAAATDPKGLGLIGMRERVAFAGGTLTIESNAEDGTTLFARIPLAPRSLDK